LGFAFFYVWIKFLARAEGADGLWEALFNQLGALGGDAAQVGRYRRSGEHERERNERETEARNTRGEEHVVGIFDIEPECGEGHVLGRLDVLKDCESKEEEKSRKRCKDR